MLLRPYTGSDAEATLGVFLRAVRTTASGEYSPEQTAAWAPDGIKVDGWNASRGAHNTVVATAHDRAIGFTDLDDDGFIDMMFVDPDFSRRGVASALMGWIVARARERGNVELSSHVSLTARPFLDSMTSSSSKNATRISTASH